MEALKTIEQYNFLINDAKKKGGKFTNNSCLIEDVRRYIDLKRIYYVNGEAGLIFVIDEDSYYRLLLHIDADKPLGLPKLEKPGLVFTWYAKDKKKPALLKVEEQLKKEGFVLETTQVDVKKDLTGMQDFYRKKYLRVEKILRNLNARVVEADYSHYGQICELLENQEMIKYFQFPYQTEDEIKADFENGDYIAVVNDNGDVLAYSRSRWDGRKCYGYAMVVKEEYKLYGLAPLLSYRGWSRRSGIRETTIALDNDQSIKFHEGLGWTFTDRYMDNWLKK